MIDEDSEDSNEGNGQDKISRVGYIEMKKKQSKSKKGKMFKPVHCIVIGGSFYWYKSPKDVEPIAGCDLGSTEIVNDVRDNDRDCFAVRDSDGNDLFLGYLTSETSRGKWVDDLNEAKALDPKPFPVREKTKTKKQNIVNRTKNKVVSGTATSVLGKKVMRAIINEETTSLLTALKNIVKKESRDDKKGERLEKNIIKISVKAFLIIEKGKIQPEDFLKMDTSLRSAFELLSKCYAQKKRVNRETLVEGLQRVESYLKESEEILTNLLAPYLTPKNLFRISSAFGCIADAVFLEKAFNDESLEEELEKLIDAMDYYTQFHYD